MTRPDHEIDAYLEGQLTDEQARAIDAWIAADPANAAAFLHLVRTHQTLDTLGKEQRVKRQVDEIKPNELDTVTLASIAQLETATEPDLIVADPDSPISFRPTGQDHSARQRVADSFVSYVLRKALTSRPVFAVYGAAAVLLLGVTLFFALTGGSETPNIVITPDEPREATALLKAVATLTGEYNAAWDHRPERDLYAGQRFTLTAGFAEITTSRGAIAFIEAPASIEFIDSSNGLRLHEGKLFGICETESSKGFLVQTPSVDVTDLGTRFGVSVDQAGESLVNVFDGLVLAKPNAVDQSTSAARELGVGESIAVDNRGRKVERDPSSTETFASLAAYIGGVSELSGDVVRATPERYIGKDVSSWPKDARAVVFPEQTALTLTETLQTSSLSLDPLEQPEAILPGTIIRTYILLYLPGTSTPSRVEGTVTFEGEILGVIFHDKWKASLHTLKSGTKTDLFDIDKRAGSVELYDFDKLEIRSDSHELAFDLQASVACDAMRIVVREPVGESK